MTSKQNNAHTGLPSRFWSKVQPKQSGCWLWTGQIQATGYGRFSVGGRGYRAHRVSYQYFKGAIPAGLFVCHRCDVRNCVNPQHLFLGTPAQNSADMRAKGRQQRGGKHWCAKLTESDVRKIRKAPGSHPEIAKEFGVDRSLVTQIKSRKLWGHVQ